MKEYKDLLEYREFLRQYTLQQLRNRYRGSVLGFLWTLINPAMVCLTFTLVFSYINRMEMRTFGVYFFSGFIPWTFFQTGTNQAIGSIVGNPHYITRVYLPKVIFPLAAVLINFVDFLAALPLIFLIMYLTGAAWSQALLVLPLSILLLSLFVIGLGLLFATINVYLRDFQFLWTSLSFMLFFFTPIIFPITMIPPQARGYFELNPVYSFIRLFQDPISKGTMPSMEVVALSAVYAVLAVLVGALSFSRAQKSFYMYL